MARDLACGSALGWHLNRLRRPRVGRRERQLLSNETLALHVSIDVRAAVHFRGNQLRS
jgi:hypothetical protein